MSGGHRQAAFAFGKYQGRFLKNVAKENAEYLERMVRSDFPSATKTIVEAALRGSFPKPKVKGSKP